MPEIEPVAIGQTLIFADEIFVCLMLPSARALMMKCSSPEALSGFEAVSADAANRRVVLPFCVMREDSNGVLVATALGSSAVCPGENDPRHRCSRTLEAASGIPVPLMRSET